MPLLTDWVAGYLAGPTKQTNNLGLSTSLRPQIVCVHFELNRRRRRMQANISSCNYNYNWVRGDFSVWARSSYQSVQLLMQLQGILDDTTHSTTDSFCAPPFLLLSVYLSLNLLLHPRLINALKSISQFTSPSHFSVVFIIISGVALGGRVEW